VPSPSPGSPNAYDRVSMQPPQLQWDFQFANNDIFDTNIPIQGEFDTAIFNSTQEFWENFPGEVEMY